MRILVVNSFVGRGAGGQERVALDLAIGLARMGHSVSILGPYSRCEDLRRQIPSNITVFEEPWARRTSGEESAAGLFRSALRIIRHQRIEIVSGHGRMFPVWLACRLARVPLVWTLHGAATALDPRRFDLKSAAVRVAFRRLLEGKLAHIVGVSEFTRICFLQMIKLANHSKVSVIRNGSAALPLLSNMPVPTFKGVLRLGYVGRIENCKGIFDFAPLCQRLLELGVPFSLRIYGNGSEEERLRCALGRWMRDGVVSFEGYEGDPRKIYSSFDVLVHPARAEWLGMSLIECQAAARVVVAYRSGGVPEIITDSVSGFTLPVGDTDSMASTVESLYKNPAVAVQIALKAREMVKTHCSLDRMCRDYELLFEEVLC